ncbi:MAG: rod shape-determining protein MreD [bacterium]
MNELVLLLFGTLGILLRSTLFRSGLLHYFAPDTTLLIVLYATGWFPYVRGLILSLSIGLLADLFSGAPEGWNATYACLVFILGKGIQARLYLTWPRASIGLFVAACVLKLPVLALLSSVGAIAFPVQRELIRLWAGECVATLLLMPLVFLLLSKSLDLERLPSTRKAKHGSS